MMMMEILPRDDGSVVWYLRKGHTHTHTHVFTLCCRVSMIKTAYYVALSVVTAFFPLTVECANWKSHGLPISILPEEHKLGLLDSFISHFLFIAFFHPARLALELHNYYHHERAFSFVPTKQEWTSQRNCLASTIGDPQDETKEPLSKRPRRNQ